MKKLIIAFLIIALGGCFPANTARPGSEKYETARKFKEVEGLVKETGGDQRETMMDIMPEIKEAEKFFKKKRYQEAQGILDSVIAKLRSIEKGETKAPPVQGRMDASRINTSGWQDTPYISGDGENLFFTYSPHDFMQAQKTKFRKIEIKGPIRAGHTRDEYITKPQVLVTHNYVSSRKADGGWSEPEPIHYEVSDRVGGSMWISNDDNVMYLAGWGKRQRKNYGSGDIYVAKRKSGNRWTKPDNLGRTINTRHLEDNPHASADGTVLYFDSDRPGGRGRWDIYHSVKSNNDTWSKPVNLGPPVNTSAVEGMPFLSENGKRLYFVRGDPVKLQPTQIYVSTKQPDNSWSDPLLVDLGLVDVSSPSLTSDEKLLYFLWVNYRTKEMTIWYSRKKDDGRWETPRPVD